jgi:hypothetical protein
MAANALAVSDAPELAARHVPPVYLPKQGESLARRARAAQQFEAVTVRLTAGGPRLGQTL